MILVALFGLLLLSPTLGNKDVMDFIFKSRIRMGQRGYFDRSTERGSVLGQARSCVNGKLTIEGEDFPCKNVDFLSFVSMKDLEMLDPPHDLGFGFGASNADIWGWLSPTGREITIVAMDNGVVVIDGTDPINPCIIAKMPTGRIPDQWGDVKVYKDTLYHVKDTRIQDNDRRAPPGNAEYGIEVYDLKQLDQINCYEPGYIPINLYPQYVSPVHGRSHNVAINPESGLLYSTGTEQCNGGLVILSVKEDPMRPVQVGCADSDGYTHDVQCLIYDGPDTRFTGSEICFAFNEDTLTIWNIDDPANPDMIARKRYPNQVYSHQGWVNDELTKILLDDELDEVCNEDLSATSRCLPSQTNELSGERRTTTNVFDITDLTDPKFEGAYVHPDLSIDHNLYVWGSVHRRGHGGNPAMETPPLPYYAYMNNYVAGLKIVDIRSDNFTEWFQAGYFDLAPDLEGNEFLGAWSGYMHPSGVYAISSIERGVFFLSPRTAFSDVGRPESVDNPTDDGGSAGGDASDDENSVNPGLIGFVVLLGTLFTLMVANVLYRHRTRIKEAVAFQPLGRELAASVRQNSRVESKSSMNPMHDN